MAAPRVRVALPWLQGALAEASANDALPAMHALRWLGGRGRLQIGEPRSWREWLLEPVGGADVLARWPAGAALANQNGLDRGGPRHLVHRAARAPCGRPRSPAARAARPGRADPGRSRRTRRLREFAFRGRRTDCGGLRPRRLGPALARSIDCSTQPPDAVVGHDVHDFMPSGRDGARIRSLMNEIQMLLHEHPVNLRRERARQLPVNGWWLWGFGEAAADAAAHERRSLESAQR